MFASTVYFVGLHREHFICSFTASTENDANLKAIAFVNRIKSHPAQKNREYNIR